MDGKTVLIGAAAAAAGFIGYSLLKGQVTRAEQDPLQNTINAYSQGQISNYQSTNMQSPLNWQSVINNPFDYGITFDAMGRPIIPPEVKARLPTLGGVSGVFGIGGVTGQLDWKGVYDDLGIFTAFNAGLEFSGKYNKPFQTWFNNEILPYYTKYKDEIDKMMDKGELSHMETLYKVHGTNPFVDFDKLYLADKVYQHKYGNSTLECDGTVSADVAIIDGVKYKITGGGGERIRDPTGKPLGGQWQQGDFRMIGKPATGWTPTMEMVNPFDDYYQYKSEDIWLESVGVVPADKAKQVLTLLSQGKIDQAKSVVHDSYDTPAALIGKPEVAQAISQTATYHPGTKAGGYDSYGNLREWWDGTKWKSTQELAKTVANYDYSSSNDYGYSTGSSGTYADSPGLVFNR